MDDGAGTQTGNHDYRRTDTAADGKPGTRIGNNGPGIKNEVKESEHEHGGRRQEEHGRDTHRGSEENHGAEERIKGEDYTNSAAIACNRDDVIKLHPQSHTGSHFPFSKPLILLTTTHTHEPHTGSELGSGERRGATLAQLAFCGPGRCSCVTPAGSGLPTICQAVGAPRRSSR